ncbi:hypothetical protein SAMN07250955_105230 [Arboricoccus pini]|uniref:Uncharacterized protein n=1 Tax=Arboricoccus pini TaxID=1963835 RepID=A0A212R4K7_9PROT|nr:hypothetical protein [Arboricoccus pini]SNB66983.1 hypothetical protein SAMN07250955_105230 [Arboricoccus pini]
MAYTSKNLSALAYANGFTLWHYKTADISAVVDTSGYFNDAANMLRAGDFVFINASVAFSTNGTPMAVGENGVMVVVSNVNGVVDVADLTAFGSTNTD